jgi:hypothetical protein
MHQRPGCDDLNTEAAEGSVDRGLVSRSYHEVLRGWEPERMFYTLAVTTVVLAHVCEAAGVRSVRTDSPPLETRQGEFRNPCPAKQFGKVRVS